MSLSPQSEALHHPESLGHGPALRLVGQDSGWDGVGLFGHFVTQLFTLGIGWAEVHFLSCPESLPRSAGTLSDSECFVVASSEVLLIKGVLGPMECRLLTTS